MLQYKLIPEWLCLDEHNPFNIISVNQNNILNYKSEIIWLIDCFNKRYEWDGFPTWEIVLDRVNSDKNLFFLCEYNYKIIGWGWFKKGKIDINKPHIKFYASTNETTFWGYNLFLISNKIIQKPHNSGTLWCSLMFKRLIENGAKEILLDIESWQDASIKMCEGSGMKQQNWITNIIENA